MGTLLRTRLRGQKGFTLMELMIVVNIIGILTLIAIPAYMSMRARAEDSANKANVRNALTLIDVYYQDNATYSGMSLAALRSTYDGSFDVSRYELMNVSDTNYCIQSPSGVSPRVWRKNGPGALFENAHC